MEQLNITVYIKSCQMDELQPSDEELVRCAMRATDHSYSEYSHFCVGAALRLDDGRIIIGANQENAAFSATLCAERSAIFAAQAQYPEHHIVALAIAARNEDGFLTNPVSPCGECRQVMLQIEDRYKKPMRLLLYGTKCIYCLEHAADLLPLSFVESSMQTKKN